MRTKSKTVIYIAILLAFMSFLPFLGCRKRREAPPPTPTPTNTPVPHMEKIIYTYNGELLWMNTDGSGKEVLFPDNNSKWYPSASPDGWYVVYWVQTSQYYNLWLGNFKLGKAAQITFDQDTLEGDVQNFSMSNSVGWSDDSSFIVYSRNKDIWKLTRDGYNPEALTSSHDCISPALSKDNKLVFVKNENENISNLYIKDIGSFNAQKLTNVTGMIAGSPHFSPDGSKVVYTVSDSDNVDMYMIDINSLEVQQLTYDGKSNSPIFSHDGSRIYFSSFVSDKYQPDIWSMNADKSEKIKITKDGGVSPSWLFRTLAAPLPTFVPTEENKGNQAGEEIFPGATAGVTQVPSAAIAQEAPAQTAEAPGQEELTVRLIKQGDNLIFYPTIHFDIAVADIKKEFYPVLNDMVKIISKYRSPVIIDGHTDNSPIRKKYPNNMALSIARAKAVRKYLINKGISLKRIKVEGFGDTRPIVPNDTEEDKYRNRRAEIHIKIMTAEEAKAEEQAATPTPAVTDTPTPEPTATPTPKPKNIFEQLFKPKGKKAAGW